MKMVVWIILSSIFLFSTANAGLIKITVQTGENAQLISAINTVNSGLESDEFEIIFVDGPNGEHIYEFSESYEGSNNAIPVIKRNVHFKDGRVLFDEDKPITFRGSGNADFRLLTVEGNARFRMTGSAGIEVVNFGVTGERGGAILANDNALLIIESTTFRNNFSGINGGAIAITDHADIGAYRSMFEGNNASNMGGAISIEGSNSVDVDLDDTVNDCVFKNNNAGVYGCDLNFNTPDRTLVNGNFFDSGTCPNVPIENPWGPLVISGNTIIHGENAIDSTDEVLLFGNILDGPQGPNQVQAAKGYASKIQAACNDFGTNAFTSDGFNISTEDSCSLTQDTDQPNTDPALSTNGDNLPVLEFDNPAIDAGSAEVYVPQGQDLAILPCGYVDINGVARPQDGNDDGNYECDSGVAEFSGSGVIEGGHSGAFYNSLRNGEGSYVEVLSDSLAVVYTFTYRPDGSGPSWFIGVGEIRDNGIVIDDLLRPTGTSFGGDFDPAAIDYSDAGGMSMVFSACNAVGGGGVAYSGNPELGYEGLLTRAQRITSIAGCNVTPTANAGLSGSFYDPARNGEGLIVEWLTSGDVVAIFFTYDQNGDQFWTFGVGTPSGKSVTINALYPAASTVWGQNFNPNDVDLQSWGTFSLNWTTCDSLNFDYNSTVSGYGSGSYNYTRVSTLQGTTCPSF